MFSSQLEPAFFSSSVKTIKYCSKPLRLMDNNDKIEEIPVDIFSKKHNFEWTNSILVPPKQRDLIWADKIFPKTAITQIEERLHNPLDNYFVVCNMGKFGHGLFHALDAPVLPIGTVIGIYAAAITERPPEGDEYSMSAREDEHKPSIIKLLYKAPSFSAIKHGNALRFVQDLPEKEKLEGIDNANSLPASNIASANLGVMSAVLYGVTISYLFTSTKVQPGDQYGFPYQGTHWRGEKKQAIFDNNANHIGYFENERTVIFLNTFKPSEKNRVPRREDIKLLEPFIGPLVRGESIDKFDAEKRFIGNINYCLDIFINRYKNDNDKLFLENLNNCKNIITAEEITTISKYNKLREALKTFTPALAALKSELYFHMGQYAKKIQSQQNVQKNPNVEMTTQFNNLKINEAKNSSEEKEESKVTLKQ